MQRPIKRGKMKRRLVPLWQKIVAWFVVACAIVMPRWAHAAKTQTSPSFSERALKVKKAINKMTSEMNDSGCGPLLMQWPNWGNWNNWPNWLNWNKWNNWANWVNW